MNCFMEIKYHSGRLYTTRNINSWKSLLTSM